MRLMRDCSTTSAASVSTPGFAIADRHSGAANWASGPSASGKASYLVARAGAERPHQWERKQTRMICRATRQRTVLEFLRLQSREMLTDESWGVLFADGDCGRPLE